MTVHRDQKRGHFVLDADGYDLTGVDLGGVLHLSGKGRVHLTPDDARALADALTWWADRHHDAPREYDNAVADELNDLFDLLDPKES
jgi:hypothetical protein